MEILEYTDVLSPVQIEEVKKQISYCQIAFGKFINGYSCVYLRVNQEKLKERGEVGLTASYVINKKGAFLNLNQRNGNAHEVTSFDKIEPIDIKRIFTFSSENDDVELDAFSIMYWDLNLIIPNMLSLHILNVKERGVCTKFARIFKLKRFILEF